MRENRYIHLHKIFLFYLGISAVAALWIALAHLEVVLFGWKGIPEAFILGLALFSVSLHVSQQHRWAKDLEKVFMEILTPLSVPTIFAIAAMSGFAEELLFRGAVQNQFGIVIASLLFGLIHLPTHPKMIPWTLSAIVMGFILGGLYLYSGNLLAPMILHFLINFLNICAMNQKNLSA